jgi:1-acyl-sn-glycerol-3-phosphate acyltransferase
VFYWLLKRIVLGPVLRTLFRPWVKGLENVPPSGGAILASNHLSFSDSVFLPLVVPRRVTFLAKSDYFTGRGVKGRTTAAFFKGIGQLPIDRSGGRAGEAALRTGLRVLNRGDLLGIYPEGTRSPDGRLYRGKTGVARMALEGKVPVLPVAMIGTDRVQPIGRRLPSLGQGRVGIVIGKPLDFSRYEGMAGDRFVLRSITDEIVYELMRLSGQEYADVYATTMKERLAAASVKEVTEQVKERISAARRRVQHGDERPGGDRALGEDEDTAGAHKASGAQDAPGARAPGGRPVPQDHGAAAALEDDPAAEADPVTDGGPEPRPGHARTGDDAA